MHNVIIKQISNNKLIGDKVKSNKNIAFLFTIVRLNNRKGNKTI